MEQSLPPGFTSNPDLDIIPGYIFYTPSSNISPFNISNVYNKMNSSCAQLIQINVKPDLIRALRIVNTSCQPEDENNNKSQQIKT